MIEGTKTKNRTTRDSLSHAAWGGGMVPLVVLQAVGTVFVVVVVEVFAGQF